MRKKLKIKIMTIVGTRPNFIKIAQFTKILGKNRKVKHFLVHTGQHYDTRMSKVFFKDLGIPDVDINLGVKKTSHAEQTAEIMKRFEKVCFIEKPDCVVVTGDVNSTIACALTAVKLGIKVAHIEAGLRSFDRSMPEEINRILTDQISEYLFVTERSGYENLLAEGISKKKIFMVGNTMIDTLLANIRKTQQSRKLSKLKIKEKEYILLTLHRPANVDNPQKLNGIIRAIIKGVDFYRIIFPVHPRTKKNLSEGNIQNKLLTVIEPLGYIDFLKVMKNARLVLTDSGGIQEETSFLKIPCLTLRNNTERPITVTNGTNKIIGVTPNTICIAIKKELKNMHMEKVSLPLWDGKASERIAGALVRSLI